MARARTHTRSMGDLFLEPSIKHDWRVVLGKKLYDGRKDAPKLRNMDLCVYAGLRGALLCHVDGIVLGQPFHVDNTMSDDLAFVDCIMVYLQARANYRALRAQKQDDKKRMHQDWKRVYGMIHWILTDSWYAQQTKGELPCCLQPSHLEHIQRVVYGHIVVVGVRDLSGVQFEKRAASALNFRWIRALDPDVQQQVGATSLYHFLAAVACYHMFTENTVANTAAHACYCCHRSRVPATDMALQRQLAGMNKVIQDILGFADRRHASGEACIAFDKTMEPKLLGPEYCLLPFDFAGYAPPDPIQIVAK